MSDIFFVNSLKKSHSSSNSPTKPFKSSLQNLTNTTVSAKSPSKFHKFIEKRESFKKFPYIVSEVQNSITRPARSFSTRKLSQLTPVFRSLSTKSPTRLKRKPKKRIEADEFFLMTTKRRSQVSYKVDKLTEQRGVFQLEILSQPVLDAYTEMSEQSNLNLKLIKQKTIGTFLEVQKEYQESETKERKSAYLTEQDLKVIITQYDLPNTFRNYSKIDEILSNLEFFVKFPSRVRMQIYSFCRIIHALPGQYIFKQGDIGEHVYVILKGSVVIEKTLKEVNSYDLIVNSIYDGKHFGDLSLLSHLLKQPNKLRQASCMSVEDSYFFQIPKDIYAEILFNTQRKEIEQKVKFFEECKLFKSMGIPSISSIATIVSTTTFQIDDVLVRKGEIPKGLFIIYSGNAVMFTQGYRVQGIKSKYIRKRMISKEKHSKDKIKESIIQRALFNNIGPLTPRTLETVKDFIPAHNIEDPEFPIVKENLEFASLYPQDYFGGRVLLQANDQDKSLASKFTIIVKSAILKAFIIDKFVLQNFSDEIIQQMRTILSKCYEIDCPPEIDPKEMTSKLKKWLVFKNDFTEKINLESFVRRNKSEYPFIRN